MRNIELLNPQGLDSEVYLVTLFLRFVNSLCHCILFVNTHREIPCKVPMSLPHPC